MGNFNTVTGLGKNAVSGTGISSDAWGRQKTYHDVSLIHGMFTYNIPSGVWKESLDDVEQTSFTQAVSTDGKLVLTSTTLNVNVKLSTFRHARYQPNRGYIYSTSIFLPNKTNTGQRSFGAFTEDSGVGFRLKSDGKLYAWRRTTIGGTPSDVEEEITLPSNVDLEKGNLFDIQFQWRGVGNYLFYINGCLVHQFDLVGTQTELTTFNPALPIAYECIDQGQTVVIQGGCVDVSAEGGDSNEGTYGSIGISTDEGTISTTLTNQPVLVVRSKGTIGSLANTRDVQALFATAHADFNSVFRVWGTRDNTAITVNDQSYADFGDGHLEFIEFDNPNVTTPMTFDSAKANLQFTAFVKGGTSFVTPAIFEGNANIHQSPGETFIFTMHRDVGGTADVGVTYEFAELI